MNLVMYIDFVAPIQLATKLNIPFEDARDIVLKSLSEETLNSLTDDEKEYLGII